MIYTLQFEEAAIDVIATHLRRGAYDDVVEVLNSISQQVAQANFAAEQAALQSAAVSLKKVLDRDTQAPADEQAPVAEAAE
jgi:hypothetical protein